MPRSFSIIIPTLNRAGLLRDTLESVARVVPPKAPVEIIVVDNGSIDKTRDAFNTVSEKYRDTEWKYFYESMPGLLSGRHRGAAEARGEVLCYLDDDVLLAPSWLDAIEDAFRDPTVALVGGPSRPSFLAEPPDWLPALWWNDDEGQGCTWLSLIDSGPYIKLIDHGWVWGLNFSIRKDVFYSCGGFHPDYVPKPLQRFQGDGETGLALKAKDRGGAALYHPAAAVTHVIPASRLTPKAFAERAFYCGVCDSYTEIRRERQVSAAPQPGWKDILRPLKCRLEKLVRQRDADEVQRLIGRAYVAGMQFHKSEVLKDPQLLGWVLKENYFDYSLPEGAK
jgi:glycosyltransferase involved in cell wall biosynthesis